MLTLRIILLAAVLQANHAFQSPTNHHRHTQRAGGYAYTFTSTSLSLSSTDIQAKLKAQMAKLQERDRASVAISPNVSVLLSTFASA